MEQTKEAAECDIWLALYENMKRDLVADGLPEEEASERASAEIRRQIRQY